MPEQVLVDNAKALVRLNNPSTGELVINSVFAAFARSWGFPPKACWPNPGLIQSVSQVLWSGLSAWVELSGLAPALCLKPLLPQPISI